VSHLKVLPFVGLAKVAHWAGFREARRKGSHVSFKHADGRIVVIPDHGRHEIVRPLLRKIIRDLGLTVEQYNEALASV